MGIQIRPATLADRPAIYRLMDVAFDAESYGPSLSHPCESVGHSHMDPHDRADNTRILVAEGQIVSVVHIAERQAYACEDLVPFGFIAMVATHPDHRHRGYMRRVMTDAETYMKSNGLGYALLFGRFGTYGRYLGWHWCREQEPTLDSKYVVPACAPRDCSLRTRTATEDDVSFLSRAYEARYAGRFGPVVRSHEYWRRWSLKCHWEGVYVVVCDGTLPVGYFHICDADIDEIGWDDSRQEMQERICLAAVSWAAMKGVPGVGFWVDEADDAATAAVHRAFGDVPRTFADPGGKTVDGGDTTPYLPANRADGVGHTTKFLNRGPGILARVDSTERLTEAMARHSWAFFGGDTM